jgi:hypothetical protein
MFPPQYLHSVTSGSARLVVIVEATYRDLDTHLHCYRMRYGYVSFLDKYDPDGGSSTCTATMPTYSSQTIWDKVVGDKKMSPRSVRRRCGMALQPRIFCRLPATTLWGALSIRRRSPIATPLPDSAFSTQKDRAAAVRRLPPLLSRHLELRHFWPKSNMSNRSPIAGGLPGTYGSLLTVGSGRLSRLRLVRAVRPQLRSMNFRTDT